jgi:hypothetical protein
MLVIQRFLQPPACQVKTNRSSVHCRANLNKNIQPCSVNPIQTWIDIDCGTIHV